MKKFCYEICNIVEINILITECVIFIFDDFLKFHAGKIYRKLRGLRSFRLIFLTYF